MKIHQFQTTPNAHLARKLEAFDRQFEYPLGQNNYFCISHGTDYSRFFRTIGEAACFVAEKNDRVVGVLTTVVRRVWLPDGRETSVVYLCDLKITPEARGGIVLSKLVLAARGWHSSAPLKTFSVVMDGTASIPTQYTGRAGIPALTVVGEVTILRFSVNQTSGTSTINVRADCRDGLDCFRRLSVCRYATPCGDAAARSLHQPAWLVLPGGQACGLLEDTLRAKRLTQRDGSEMISAHLSCFAFQAPDAGAQLILSALALCWERGLPALFTAIAKRDSGPILAVLRNTEVTVAPATIFGAGLDSGPDWNVNTAEV